MKTFQEWRDEETGYSLFLAMRQDLNKQRVFVFCDWLEENEMPYTAELLRSRISSSPHGYWSKMANEMAKESIKFGDNEIIWNNRKYRIFHDRILTFTKSKWESAEEDEVKKIFPALAVLMLQSTHSKNYQINLFHGYIGTILNDLLKAMRFLDNSFDTGTNPSRQVILNIQNAVEQLERTLQALPNRSDFIHSIEVIEHWMLRLQERLTTLGVKGKVLTTIRRILNNLP